MQCYLQLFDQHSHGHAKETNVTTTETEFIKQTNKKLVDAKLKLPKTTRVPTLSRSTKQLLADKSKIIIQNNTMAHNKAIWIVISTQLKDKMIGYTNK